MKGADSSAAAVSAGGDMGANLALRRRRPRSFVMSGDSAGVALCAVDAVVILVLGVASHLAVSRQDPALVGSPVLLAVLASLLTAGGIMERGGYGQAPLLGGRPALRDLSLALLQAFGAVFLVRAAVLVWQEVQAYPAPRSAAPFAADVVWLAAFAATSFAALAVSRFAWRRLAPSMILPFRVLIVGNGEIYHDTVLRARSDAACDVTGVFYDRAGTPGDADAASMASALLQTIREDGIDSVIIALPWEDGARISGLAGGIAAAPVDIYIAPDIPAGDFLGHSMTMLAGVPVLKLNGRPLSAGSAALKRAEDLALALVLLVLAAPAMLVIAVLIKITSAGPVFFRQRRLGYNNEMIKILKFRTMYADAADIDARRQTSRGDPRVTPLGVFLRRSSLDELPQLLNVLAGHMSMVGPRPHALQTTVEGVPLDEVVSDYMARHRVKPGITGWAQVNGYRGELNSAEKLAGRVNYDLEYIRNWSLAFDLKIIWRTVRLMLSDPHAY